MCKGVYRDITGQRFGKLTVLPTKSNKRGYVVCKCDCGTIKDVVKRDVLSGATRSCGASECKAEVRRMKKESQVIESAHTNNQSQKSFENNKRVLDINKVYKKMYQISKNPKKSKKNFSGCVGVTWNRKMKRWIAGIGFRGENIYLGAYKDFEEAVAARKEAEEMCFSPSVISSKEFENAIKMC